MTLVTHETHGGLARLTLNRPERLNALTPELLTELKEALHRAGSDATCRCVLLTGAGRGFCSGADLMDLDFAGDTPLDFGAPLEEFYHPVIRTIRAIPKPVIAGVNGVAAGAGCNLACAADIVVGTRSATFIQAFVRIGLVPDAGGTWLIPRLIGRSRAMHWMMSGHAIDSSTAERWGLISAIYEDNEFDAKLSQLAAQMASQPTKALAGIKKLVDESAVNDLDQQLALEQTTQTETGYTRDALEGVAAFIEKRDAKFSGI